MNNKKLLITGYVTTLLGSYTYDQYIKWVILDETNSAAFLGIATAITSVALFFAQFLGGIAVDKYSPKRTMCAMELISATAALLSIVCIMMNFNLLITVIILNTVLVLTSSVYSIASKAALPYFVVTDHLKSFNSIQTACKNVLTLVSPILAYIMIKIGIDPIYAILLNLITFLLNIFWLIRLKPVSIETKKVATIKFKEAFKVLYSDRVIFKMIIAAGILNFYLFGFELLEKSIGKIYFSSVSIYMLIGIAAAIGAIFAAFLVHSKNDSVQRILSFIDVKKMIFLQGMVILPFVLFSNIYTFLFATFFISFLTIMFNIEFFTLVQLNIDRTILGKVFAIIFLIATSTAPIANLVYGYLIEFDVLITCIVTMVGLIILSLIIPRTENRS
ncbi:hypothetical protein COJ27_22635 [Bacillus cereus]|uniref:MFS transporter n=1 Tax=Bacillus cereus TaxID=1396 RepID=UPI000BF5C8B9|nr:MFS transporter [Bacillus cereus]PFL59903.1 hypothetical protein COJ27_22635 [Bacillus cereus]